MIGRGRDGESGRVGGKTTERVWRQNILYLVIEILFVINHRGALSEIHFAQKYILNNSKYKQINATPKNIKLISILF